MHNLWVISWILGLVLYSSDLVAHGGIEHSHVWPAWNSTLIISVNLSFISLLYAVGWKRLTRSASSKLLVWRVLSFYGSIIVLAAALLSPVDSLSDHLGYVHMIQHMLIMMIAAPLFICGHPAKVILWAFPQATRRRYWSLRRSFVAWKVPYYGIVHPLITWAVFGLTLWVWHIPALYESAVADTLIHDLQHLAFFLSACLFWRILIDPLLSHRVVPGVGIVYLFLASVHSTALGVLMAYSPKAWYGVYEQTTGAFGLSAVEDQQLAGYIMWMPACTIYLAIALVIFGRWIIDLSSSASEGIHGANTRAANR